MLEDAIRYADPTLILIQEVKATFPTTLVINDESEDYKYTFNLPEDHVTTWRDTINMNGPPFWGLAVGVPRNSDIETKMIIDTSPRFQTVIRRKLLIVNVYLPVHNSNDKDSDKKFVDSVNDIHIMLHNVLDDGDIDAIFICGDFNASEKHPPIRMNTLKNLCKDYDFLKIHFS